VEALLKLILLPGEWASDRLEHFAGKWNHLAFHKRSKNNEMERSTVRARTVLGVTREQNRDLDLDAADPQLTGREQFPPVWKSLKRKRPGARPGPENSLWLDAPVTTSRHSRRR
jgi:hypothetical protein